MGEAMSMPGFVTVFAGPHDGEQVPVNEVDWAEVAANAQRWKGYTWHAGPDGTLLHVRYKHAKPHGAA
jgi:hypothetical protein